MSHRPPVQRFTDHDHGFRFVAFASSGYWISVCLDHYLMAFCREAHKVRMVTEEMLAVHVEASGDLGVTPFVDLPPAPERYQSLWLELERREATERAAKKGSGR